MTSTLSASLEDYLEAILSISDSKGAARSKDIAQKLSVKGPSVTGALRMLAEKGLVNYAPYDIVSLTSEGRKLAEDVAQRHEVLNEFLSQVLMLDETTARKVACQMEHAINGEVLERLVQFISFVKHCPRGGFSWIRGSAHNCRDGEEAGACTACIEQCLADLPSPDEKEKGETQMYLADLKPGERGTISGIEAAGNLRQRMLDMGVIPGSLVEVTRISPLGDPVEVIIKGYHLSLRRDETALILVKKEQTS